MPPAPTAGTTTRKKRPLPTYEDEEERAAAAAEVSAAGLARTRPKASRDGEEEEGEEEREDYANVPCKFYRHGHCLRGDGCIFLHKDCPFGEDCDQFADCRLGHPPAWNDRREAARPCRRFRTGYCPYGAKCRYIHQMCEMGLACQASGCRFGHPREWVCFGCERCHYGVTGAGVLLLTPSHQPGQCDVVLVEELSRDERPVREWGDMGGRIDAKNLGGEKEEEEEEEEEEGAAPRGTTTPTTSIDYANVRLSVLAASELEEETAGTVKVEPRIIAACPFVDTGVFHRYRCFLLLHEPVSVHQYQQARKRPSLPRAYRESLDMRRFPLAAAVGDMTAAWRVRVETAAAAAAAAEQGATTSSITTTATAAAADGDDGCLMPRHIRSHKGKAHALAERCRRALSLAYEAGMLDPYYALSAPVAASAPAPSPSLLQGNGDGGGIGGGGGGSTHCPPLLSSGLVGGGGGKRKTGLLRPPGMRQPPPPPGPSTEG